MLIHGPPSTPYEGYSFRLEYKANLNPFHPPKVRFLDVPWSPFVCEKNGEICCDILGKEYNPLLTLNSIIISIVSLLT